jgi:predicted nucleic acid-binding protein
LPIVVDTATEACGWATTMALDRQYRLSAYDAAYLDLALREAVPLATLDAQLEAAAASAGISRYQP